MNYHLLTNITDPFKWHYWNCRITCLETSAAVCGLWVSYPISHMLVFSCNFASHNQHSRITNRHLGLIFCPKFMCSKTWTDEMLKLPPMLSTHTRHRGCCACAKIDMASNLKMSVRGPGEGAGQTTNGKPSHHHTKKNPKGRNVTSPGVTRPSGACCTTAHRMSRWYCAYQ